MTREKALQSAISAKCLECCCGSHAEVRDCKLKGCALWAYRPYQRAKETAGDSRRYVKSGALMGVQVDVFDILTAGG